MSKTFKDRFYNAHCDHSLNEKLNCFVGETKMRKQLKKNTNRKTRRFKGDIQSGGKFKKMFDTLWNYI